MADIFNSVPGTVFAIEAERAVPALIRIAEFEPKAALISGMEYRQRTNQQFQYSLDRTVYVYVFGDLMGDVVLAGIAFPRICSGEEGIGEVLEFYRQNRAALKAEPISVVIGKEVISGFMTELNMAAQATAHDAYAPMEEFRITINALPRD